MFVEDLSGGSLLFGAAEDTSGSEAVSLPVAAHRQMRRQDKHILIADK